MASFEDDMLLDAEDDARTIEFIKAYLPQDLKDKFSDEELYYFLDVIGEYYVGLIENSKNEDEIDIDIDKVAEYIVKQAKKDKMGEFLAEDLRWIVDGELEYGDSQEEQ